MMRGQGGCREVVGHDGAAATTTTTARTRDTPTAAASTTTWGWSCCRCGTVSRATIRRWTPTVFTYVMLVSLLVAHLLPPVWAATRRPHPPHPPPGRQNPPSGLYRSPPTTPPRVTDVGGGGQVLRPEEGGGSYMKDVRSAHHHHLHYHHHHPNRRSSSSRRSVTASSAYSRSGEGPDRCQGWGHHLQRLLYRRSSDDLQPHRQHRSSFLPHSRHSQSHTSPSLPRSPPPYSLSPPPSLPSSSSTSSAQAIADDGKSYINVYHHHHHRGLPDTPPLPSPLEVVIHHQHDPRQQPRSHHLQPKPPPQEYNHPEKGLSLSEQQNLRIEERDGEAEDRGQEVMMADEGVEEQEEEEDLQKGFSPRPLCQETEQQHKELPELCDCEPCLPFNHSNPDDPAAAQCRRSRSTLTSWMTCQICSCRTWQHRLHALFSTELPFCSHLPLNYLLPCGGVPHPDASSQSSTWNQAGQGEAGTGSADDLQGDPRFGSGSDVSCDEGCPSGSSGCLCSKKDCVKSVEELLAVDREVEQRVDVFLDLLSRYDCSSEYSVRWDCQQCQEAYKQWLCAASFTYYVHGQPVRACSTFCQQVEAMCPFFRPEVDTHEGDPSFICKDPEIEVDPSLGGDDVTAPCFQLCHVMSKADIRRTYCHDDPSRCQDIRRELEDCPSLSLPPPPSPSSPSRTDNGTGSAANATSAAAGSVHKVTGSVFDHVVVRTAGTSVMLMMVMVVVGVGIRDVIVIGGGREGRDPAVDVVVVAVAALLWVLWLPLTSYPYSCIGLT